MEGEETRQHPDAGRKDKGDVCAMDVWSFPAVVSG